MESESNIDKTLQFSMPMVVSIKCFLCDKNFHVGDESYLMFKQRLTDNEQRDISMAAVLGSAVGKDIVESAAHSKFLCNKCNELILEYELIEQRFVELKLKLIEAYNKIAFKYGEETVRIEIPENEINLQNCFVIESNPLNLEKTEIGSLRQDVVEDSLENIFVDVTEKIETRTIDNSELHSDSIENVELSDCFEEQTNIKSEDLRIQLDPELKFEEASDNNDSFIVNGDETLVNADAESLTFITEGIYLTQSDNNEKDDTISEKSTFLFADDQFSCLLCCNNNFISIIDDSLKMQEHLKNIHNILIYICPTCIGIFNDEAEFTKHLENKYCEQADESYQCEICFKIFKEFSKYNYHKQIHSKILKCHLCNESFLEKSMLDEHLVLHKTIRSFVCSVCSKRFASQYSLNSHMKIHTDRKRLFNCNICNKSFLTSANLQQHLKIHSSVKEFGCDVCQKSFATQHNLDIHKIAHTGHKPFICRTCGKSFARRAEITDHERTHTGEKPFECDICGMKFSQRTNLSTHKKTTHFNEKRHKCDICGKSFKRRRLLDYHTQAIHTGERPYKCEMCDSTFVYPEHYKKHLRIHTGVKPYSCEVCGKSFNSRDNRNAHRFIHSDKKPFECVTCGHGFMRKPLLFNHMKLAGHINDTIVVNQPRIKQISEITDTNSTKNEIELSKESNSNSFKILMDSRLILMCDEDEDKIDEIVLEEHLIDSIDESDSLIDTQENEAI